MVGEALIKQGYKLFYYKKEDSTLEADFFIRSTASLIPVEVKATSGRSKSMKILITSDHYPDIRYGIKFSKNNIGHEDRIYTFPYFCTFLLKRFMVGFHADSMGNIQQKIWQKFPTQLKAVVDLLSHSIKCDNSGFPTYGSLSVDCRIWGRIFSVRRKKCVRTSKVHCKKCF